MLRVNVFHDCIVDDFNFENTVFKSQEEQIESTVTEIEKKHVALTIRLIVEVKSDSNGGGLVDDSLNEKA